MIPTPTSAIGLPFGGYVLFSIPCTCSPSFLVFLSPAFINSNVPSFGILTWTPGISIPYKYHISPPAPTSWVLGDYAPGPTACMWVYGPSCAPPPVPTMGTISTYGISMPGSTPAGN